MRAYYGMNPTSEESPESPKPRWPLICGGIAAALLGAGLVAAVVALYIANFNLLEWIE